MNISKNQIGDTLVEVLVSTVVLTIVLSGAYTVVNRSTRFNQTSIERSEVAAQLNEQAELLRAIRDTHDGTATSNWSVAKNKALASAVNDHDCSSNPELDGAFFISVDTATLGVPTDFSRVSSAPIGEGIDTYPSDFFDTWIVAERPAFDGGSTLDNSIDFHIRTCWQAAGGETVQRSEIILRLRD